MTSLEVPNPAKISVKIPVVLINDRESLFISPCEIPYIIYLSILVVLVGPAVAVCWKQAGSHVELLCIVHVMCIQVICSCVVALISGFR